MLWSTVYVSVTKWGSLGDGTFLSFEARYFLVGNREYMIP